MQLNTHKQQIMLSIVVLLISAAWVWGSRDADGNSTGGGIPAPQTGFLAPDFTLETIDGEIITLSDLRGKGVLVNLWASWCVPCRREMPAMQNIYDQYKDQGFVVLAVNITSQDSLTAAKQFVEEYGLTFPILLDTNGVVAKLYQLRAFPSSFFIDKDGIIQEVVIGGPMAEALLQVRAEQLIQEAE